MIQFQPAIRIWERLSQADVWKSDYISLGFNEWDDIFVVDAWEREGEESMKITSLRKMIEEPELREGEGPALLRRFPYLIFISKNKFFLKNG